MSRTHLSLLSIWLVAALPARLRVSLVPRLRGSDRESGDIPGWVMIAIMSAAVVVVLIPLVGPAIARAFTTAIDNVSNTQSSGK